MKKLNAALCKDMIVNLKAARSYRGISLSEEIYLQALEIALPVLEMQESTADTYRQIENDGWIDWNGYCQPRELDGLNVKVKYGDRDTDSGPACTFYWGVNCGNPIIAYRVIENDGREG